MEDRIARDLSSDKHRKSKKKHKKKYMSSSDSVSSDNEMVWVEASPVGHNKVKNEKKKKKKNYSRSPSSESESDKDRIQWVESSSKTKFKKKKKKKDYSRSPSSNSESDKGRIQWVESSSKPKFKKVSSDEEMVQVEASPVDHNEDITKKRDSWMNVESFVHTLSKDEIYISSRQRREDALKEQRQKEEKIQKERELNPHMKNEGTGLPEKEADVDSLSLPSTSVGDGGYSWLKKAYYRIQEQAQHEGRSMEEVAVERWGSLSKLTSLIEEAEERMKSHPDWKHSRSHHKHKYNEDARSNRNQFRKPRDMYEPEKKCFDSPFQFRKPTDDSKKQKTLNQFESSKTSLEKSKYKKVESLHSLQKQHLEKNYNDDLVEKKNSQFKNNRHTPTWKKPKYSDCHDNEDLECKDSNSHIPAWKKLKHSERKEDKEMSDHFEPQPPSSSTEDAPIIVYSENDLNKLAAKQIKAEMMGDTQLAIKLKSQLEEARKIVKEKGFAKQPSKVVEEVILSKIDSQGQARPIQTTQDKISDFKRKRSNKYFDDGSSHSLKQMFEREKLTTGDDHLEMFVKASTQSNETAEIDYESGHVSNKLLKKLSSTQQEERDIGKAIQQHQKRTAALEKCNYCLDQPHMKKYLIVDIGENVYLCLPNYKTLAEGHCLIVPKSHVSSFLLLDENEWREVNDYKNQLRNMFRDNNKSVIFLETSMHFRHFPHAVVECIPVPEEEGHMAPFYFKKAIQESEAEWAHNKKLIDLTNKGLRHSVPKNLPYFCVEFDPKVHAGYAHVIEEEKDFPRNFGKEVIGGMLDIEYNYLYKNKKDDPLQKCKEVVDFQKKWKNCKHME